MAPQSSDVPLIVLVVFLAVFDRLPPNGILSAGSGTRKDQEGRPVEEH